MTAGSRRSLVIGASGQVGGALMELWGPRAVGTWAHVPLPEGLRLDLEEVAEQPRLAEAVVSQVGPDVVLVAAGMTHVDRCEAEPDRADRINRRAPAALARAARAAGARTVYISTEYVFDGTAGPYAEDALARPLSVYGRSKWEGEQAVLEADPDALVLRTTVVFGPEEQGKNFAYRLAATLREGKPLVAPADQRSSPTYNRDLAAATLRLLDEGARGTFHVAGPEVMDRAEFARRVARAAGLDDAFVREVDTPSLGQPAPRPLDAGLRVDKLRRTLPGVVLRTVEEAVRHWRAHPRGRAWP